VTFKVIDLFKAFSGGIFGTVVQQLTTFQLTYALRGPFAVGELLVDIVFGMLRFHDLLIGDQAVKAKMYRSHAL